MTKMDFSRRRALGLMGAGSVGLLSGGLLGSGTASAQSGSGLLERLRKAGVAKVGIVSAGTYGNLKPDGTVDGLAPVITETVLKRIGIPKMEPIISTYGEIIPGLLAGRWDMIGAGLGATKTRCQQVVYADSFMNDYAAYVYLPSEVPNPPKSIKEMSDQNLTVGVSAGAYDVPILRAIYANQSNVQIFPDSPTIMEAVQTKRIKIGNVGVALAKTMLAQKPGSFAWVGPLPDDVILPLSAAFRPGDTDLVAAFQAEFRKMKDSGEWEKLVAKYGFDMLPGTKEMTPEKACQLAT